MPFPTVALCSTTKFLFTLHWLIHLVFVCSKHITKDSIANMNFMFRVRKLQFGSFKFEFRRRSYSIAIPCDTHEFPTNASKKAVCSNEPREPITSCIDLNAMVRWYSDSENLHATFEKSHFVNSVNVPNGYTKKKMREICLVCGEFDDILPHTHTIFHSHKCLVREKY